MRASLKQPHAPSSRALADLVLTSLRNRRVGMERAQQLGLSSGQLAELVERFVNAGVGALVESPPFPGWLQLGVSFKPRASPARFGEALRRAVLRWQGRGALGRFFFMHKPPGMRLRFETSPLTLQTMESWLLRQPAVAKVERSIYLAEEFQFGGAMGANVAHDFHAADSLLALKAIDREHRGVISASAEVLSLLIVSDLVRRMTDDAWEAWDLWKRMEITGRRPKVGRALAKEMAELVRPFVTESETVLRHIAPAERALLRTAYENNQRTAVAMRRLAAHNQLLFHVREIIPFWIIFHWNRWGIARQGALTVGIEATLNPKQ